jgi:hypothetical protein
LLSINFNAGRLDIKLSARWCRNCAASIVGFASRGLKSSSRATFGSTWGEEGTKTCSIVEGGGVMECEVEWEAESTGVRLTCTKTMRRQIYKNY